jgi:hypothetical protein
MPNHDLAVRPESTSLRRRYELFREHDIGFYKQVVHSRTLIQLAEMARQRMDTCGDLFLGDLTLAFEVDALVAERLRLPSFRVWSGRRVHVVDGLLGGRIAAPRSVLRRSYASWTRRVQRGAREWTLVATQACGARALHRP